MLRKPVAQLSFYELKEYIKSLKSARVKGEAYELEPKFGVITFDLKKFEDADECVVSFRRGSGNGLIVLASGPNSEEQQISSKRREDVVGKLSANGELSIKRPFRSRGTVELLSMELFTHRDNTEVDWNNILRRCKEHTCLRLVDGKLMASEGAAVFADSVKNVHTKPDNMFTLSPDRVIFLGSCQILSMEIDGESGEVLDLPHMTQEPQVLKPESDSQPQRAKKHKKPPGEKKGKLSRIKGTTNSRLLFDSRPGGFAKLSCNGEYKNHGTHVTIGIKGEVVIPTKFMIANEKYVVVVEATKLSGNGKFTVRTGSKSQNTFIASGNKKAYNASLSSGNLSEGGFQVVVGRHDSSKGSVSIHRVMVLLDYDKKPYIPPPMFVDAEAALRAPAPAVTSIQERVFSYRFENNPVAKNSLSFARHTPEEYANGHIDDIDGTVSIKTFSSMSWFSKVKELLPRVQLKESGSNSSMGSIGAIVPANTMYLEEFDSNNVSDGDLSSLSNAKRILLSSNGNAEFMKEKFPNAEVKVICRMWPYVEPKKFVPVDNYMVVFNRDPKTTEIAIDALKDKFPTLVVVGARGKYPAYILPTNEYLPYPGLLYLILNARCVIDLPHHSEYNSAILNFLTAANVPICSSNWNCMSNESERIRFLIPSKNGIKNAVRELIEQPAKRNNLQDYNNKFKEAMRELFT
jgi:hypothetical protein